jgi:hypothetical protein
VFDRDAFGQFSCELIDSDAVLLGGNREELMVAEIMLGFPQEASV